MNYTDNLYVGALRKQAAFRLLNKGIRKGVQYIPSDGIFSSPRHILQGAGIKMERLESDVLNSLRGRLGRNGVISGGGSTAKSPVPPPLPSATPSQAAAQAARKARAEEERTWALIAATLGTGGMLFGSESTRGNIAHRMDNLPLHKRLQAAGLLATGDLGKHIRRSSKYKGFFGH